MEYFRITPKGLNTLICKIDDVIGYLNECEVNEKVEIQKIELTDEQYNDLPEFEGF